MSEKHLEDLLGIKENNVPGPNAHMIELKSARKNVSSMLTLFTKSPYPKKLNSILLQKYGYPSNKKKGTKRLETTVNALNFNNLRGNLGFKIVIKKDRIILIDSNNLDLCYWDKEALKNSFERKLKKLLYVKAETRGKSFSR